MPKSILETSKNDLLAIHWYNRADQILTYQSPDAYLVLSYLIATVSKQILFLEIFSKVLFLPNPYSTLTEGATYPKLRTQPTFFVHYSI